MFSASNALPKTQQKFVIQVLESVLAQAATQANQAAQGAAR
jgi:hypothetical protein